jgi:hypothetical protein
MEDQNNIIDEHLLEKKLIGVWELAGDSSRKIVEGYALSLEGYFLEIETMLDVSAISIGCGHIKSDFPLEAESGCFHNEVSNDKPFSQLLGKRLSKCRLLVGEWGNWDGLMVSFGRSTGLCFISVDCSISVLTLDGVQT